MWIKSFSPSIRSRRCSRAFTLLELAVVLIILSIAIAVAAPAYSSALQNHRVEQATLRLMADLRLAKRRAELSSTPVYVDVNLTENQVTIRGLQDFENSRQLHTIALTDEPYRTQIVQIEPSGLVTIEFNGFGAAQTAAKIRLQSGLAQRTIAISADLIEEL